MEQFEHAQVLKQYRRRPGARLFGNQLCSGGHDHPPGEHYRAKAYKSAGMLKSRAKEETCARAHVSFVAGRGKWSYHRRHQSGVDGHLSHRGLR